LYLKDHDFLYTTCNTRFITKYLKDHDFLYTPLATLVLSQNVVKRVLQVVKRESGPCVSHKFSEGGNVTLGIVHLPLTAVILFS